MKVFDGDTAAIAQWYGANRMHAVTAGQQMGPCAWVGVPFMGGASELPFFDTRAGVANDKHRHVINLARVIADPTLKIALASRLARLLFHPDELRDAQAACLKRQAPQRPGLFGGDTPEPDTAPDLDWAVDYFVCSWMGRGAGCGTKGEFRGGLSMRWTSNGGDSAIRFRSATDSLDAWHRALLPWNFTILDAFDFLGNCKDLPDHGVFCDAPWVLEGDSYTYTFDEGQHRRLAEVLGGFEEARVVVRYGDCPLVRELYPEGEWTWVRQTTRGQANNAVHEVLLLNGPERK